MAQKKSKVAKAFIFVTLIFIVFASFAVYIVMYAGFRGTENNRCKSGYTRDEEIQDCVAVEENIEEEVEINDEETCITAGGTWYEENKICIGANETQNIEENDVEINEEINDENFEEVNDEITEEVNE